ncbi:MAG: TonB-dependent receptor [bacterium]|nr:TonB-dependent receptor [bacterium]
MFGIKRVVQLVIVLPVFFGLVFPGILFSHEESLTHKSNRDALFRMSLEELMNVKITTAGKMAEKISEIPASVVIVTRHDIEMYGYQNLAEVLENIPGLYQTFDGYTVSWGVRGFWSDVPRNVVVLVNDVKQTFDYFDSYMLYYFEMPVEAIDRIEVVRGPMSVIYGNGAFFGVINIFTNKTDEDNPENLVSVSIGSEKTKKIALRASGQEGNFKYAFNGTYSYAYGIDEPYAKMVRDPAILPAYGLTDAQTTAGQLDKETKYFNFSGTFRNFSIDASYNENRPDIIAILPSVSHGTQALCKATRIKLGYKKELSDKVKLTANIDFFSNRVDGRYDILMENYFTFNNAKSSGYNAEVNLDYEPNSNLMLKIGLVYREIQEALNEYTFPGYGLNNYLFTLTDGESIITQALFAQLNFKFSGKLKVVIGTRLEQAPEYTWELRIGGTTVENPTYTGNASTYSYTTAAFIPRVALIYSISETNFLKFLYGKAINRPAFFHQAGSLGPLTTLEPETLNTFEFNYIGNLASKLSVNFSLFRNILNKLIFRSLFVVEDQIFASNANVGEMTTNGVELIIKTRPFENFNLELSGMYQHTKDNRPGFEEIEPGYSPDFLGYFKASYFINENISLAVTGNYVDEMESYYDFTRTPPARLGDSVKGYFLLGANLRIKALLDTGLYLNLRGSNLLAQEYYSPTTSFNSWATRGIIQRGASFLVTLGWKF